MSADVGPCRPWHIYVGHGRKCGIAIKISLLSHASPEMQCTYGLRLNAVILFSGCRRMSVNFDDGTVELGMVEKWGSRWNFADNMSRNVIMLVYSFSSRPV